MSITQTFYDNLASQYDKLFLDWQATTQEQAVILDKIFAGSGFLSKPGRGKKTSTDWSSIS